mmetsp:Transcript_52307/g.144922  ORF Transcript_52307/g.144922 Transcript_52307/m.144922 type:complete len:232 (-) Transcript_52307:150-845(-)
MQNVTITVPTTATSSMANFLTSLDVRMNGHGRPPALPSVAAPRNGTVLAEPGKQSLHEASTSNTTSATVKVTTKNDHMAKPKTLVASPPAAHEASAEMQSTRLTSDLSMLGMSKMSTAVLALFGNGPTGWYNGRSLMRKAMTGLLMPSAIKTAKATPIAVATAATPRCPKTRMAMGGLASSQPSSPAGASGNGKPNAATVAQTQKAQKHAKPISSCALVKMRGSWSKLRIK